MLKRLEELCFLAFFPEWEFHEVLGPFIFDDSCLVKRFLFVILIRLIVAVILDPDQRPWLSDLDGSILGTSL